MVESKFVVLQMIPHTLFIEWDFEHYSRHCSPAVLLFTELFTSRWHCSLAVCEVTVHIYCTVHIYEFFTYTVLFIYSTIHTTNFFFKCSFLDLFNLKFYA